ncbi:hypothetical protein L0B70_10450 [Kaistella sp. 97-N-M2]|uniref:hypothetical protein n=1 Tax=Kaistella sp. 97-N-M2 TaxID=2908645 RepID=UPI001F28291E|nr:hypothetical protein [Kaistella sp. 97-N-M2]UJF29257.1 hypothetical protein L0B70_10450 [Kaistella sp. 97-N-M2]
MSYTIVGMFPTNEDADKASDKLDSAGFAKEDYNVSRYSTTGNIGDSKNYDYEEDEKTTGFWNWLFGEDEHEKKKYSYAGSKSNMVTVYTDDLERAEKARSIMNDQGAINVNDFTKDRYGNNHSTSTTTDLSADERARIINKAKNNLYFTNENRTYNMRPEGMDSDMDSQASNDTF